MFSNKTAWFSSSCAVETHDLWAQHGGKLEDSSLAQFIFSDDWDHDDTKGFLTSPSYLEQHLVVFKSAYVLDAVNRGRERTRLGNYLLVPVHVLERISNKDVPSKAESDSKNNRWLSKNRGSFQDQHSSGAAQKDLCLPHTSCEGSGMIGRAPSQADIQPRAKVTAHEGGDKSLSGEESINRDAAHYANIQRIEDLPKVIDKLTTVHVKGEGVQIRSKH